MRFAVGAACLLSLGCAGPETDSVTARWGPEPVVLGPEPVVEIGSVGGDGPDAFTSVANVRFFSSGRIGVSDSGADHVVVFDASGSHVITHGRPGQGPGEFRDLARVFPYPNDSIAAFDYGNSRTLILPSGAGEARSLGAVVDGRAVIFGSMSSGTLLATRRMPRTSPVPAGEWDSTHVVAMGLPGESRVIATLPSQAARQPSEAVALAPTTFLAPAPDGFYWARSDETDIYRFDSLGALRYVITRAVEQVPITDEDADEYRAATIEDARRQGGERAAQTWEQVMGEATFAETRPLFGRAFVDQDDRLWVSELSWPSRFGTPRHWAVFADDGSLLGEVQAPPGVELHDAIDDRVLGTWRDELGVQFVHVYESERLTR